MNTVPPKAVDQGDNTASNAREFSVSPEGFADFRTITEALQAVDALRATQLGHNEEKNKSAGESGDANSKEISEPRRIRITIAPGTYWEKLALWQANVTLYGAGAEKTHIVWDDSANRLLPDGQPMGTFNSYTVYVGARGVTLQGLSIENSAGDGGLFGPAIALYADADLLSVQDCRISSKQDTLCTGPLPKNPPPKGINLIHPVAGLGSHQPSIPFHQVYRRCLIEGDVDFIFGSGLAVFENCEIRSLGRATPGQGPAQEVGGWIAAPSTYPDQKTGFVFLHCALTSEPALRQEAVRTYLARPWRHSGRAVFIHCYMDSHILPEGWDDWGKPEARTYGGFGEFGSTGPGAPLENSRASWARTLSEDEADALSASAAALSASIAAL